MQTDIYCSSCSQQYSDKNMPRILINCGHTFCQKCIKSFMVRKNNVLSIVCPQDELEAYIADTSLTVFPKNIALIKVIESKKKMGNQLKDSLIDVSKITKNSDPQEEEYSELIGFINNDNNNSEQEKSHQFCVNPQKESVNNKGYQLCKYHKKPLDVICINDLQRICASCAIFGQHKGHQFKSMEQIDTIKSQYTKSITQIINKKHKIECKSTNPEVTQQLLTILMNKKNKLRKYVSESFIKLQNKIEEKKKQSFKKLDEIMKGCEKKIKSLMKLDGKIQQKYGDWKEKSQKQLTILEENDIQAKLILLFQGLQIDGDLVKEGNSLIEDFQHQQIINLEEIQHVFQSIHCSSNFDIIESVQNFISLNFLPDKKVKIQKQVKQQKYLQKKEENKQNRQTQKHQKQQNKEKQKSKQKFEYSLTHRQLTNRQEQKKSNICFDDENLLNVQDEEFLDMSNIQPKHQPYVPENHYVSMKGSYISSFGFCQHQKDRSLHFDLSMKGNDQSFICEQKVNTNGSKKKLKKLKIPQKYEKVIEGILSDSLELVDLTNAQFGDAPISTICQVLNNTTKVKILKLIRNKLTNQGIAKILPYIHSISSLNLSQNMLTQNILDILFENYSSLPNLKTLILSQNRIIERKHKAKIQKLRKFGWIVSV